MFRGAQFVPRRSTGAGAPIKDTEEEQSREGRSQDQVLNLQNSVFVPQLVVDNSEQSHTVVQHLYDRKHCVRDAAPSQAEQSGKPFPIHILPNTTTINKDAPGGVQLMEHFVKSPSYGADNAASHRVRR